MLSDRERTILYTLVKHYINNKEPVGSRTLSKKLELNLSPATIRNIMSDLEEKGYLTHPHTSSGRIPTEKGYRFFVNEVMVSLRNKIDSLSSETVMSGSSLNSYENLQWLANEKSLEDMLNRIKERAALLSKISSILSALSHYVGIVLAPNVLQLSLKHMDFVNMGGHLCLVIFVTKSGLVFNQMINTEEIISQEQLDKMSRYVNHQFEGLNLLQIRKKILKIMAEEKTRYDQFIRQSIQLSKMAIDQQKERNDIYNVYVDGRLNILDQPEFSTPEKMRSFFSTFEEKERLINLMNQYQGANGVRVFIGSENMDPKMTEYSLVMSPYRIRSEAGGMLGVLGPISMRYWDVINMVDQVAMAMTRVFQQTQ
ncbi:heat-inducible transcription repressor HrcA [bacterium]|nr:heat-inducible transcription repressor HrcA [bacterium]